VEGANTDLCEVRVVLLGTGSCRSARIVAPSLLVSANKPVDSLLHSVAIKSRIT
jgi:hypothetical protein